MVVNLEKVLLSVLTHLCSLPKLSTQNSSFPKLSHPHSTEQLSPPTVSPSQHRMALSPNCFTLLALFRYYLILSAKKMVSTPTLTIFAQNCSLLRLYHNLLLSFVLRFVITTKDVSFLLSLGTENCVLSPPHVKMSPLSLSSLHDDFYPHLTFARQLSPCIKGI